MITSLTRRLPRDGVVAPLAGERRVGFPVVAAELLAEDVVPARALQVAAVLRRLKAAIGDPHHAGELPRPQVVLGLADQLLIIGAPRPAPHPDRDPGAGDRHRDHHLGQVIAVILAMPANTERRANHAAVLVEHVVLFLVALEVRRGRVKEQQIDLEVEQIRGREVHGLCEVVLDLQQPVHRPVNRSPRQARADPRPTRAR
jgi:hypothetical protein